MQVRIRKSLDEDMTVLVDWRILEPFWLRSTFAPVDRDKLINAYSELWFDKKSFPWSFKVGEIFFRLNEKGEREIQAPLRMDGSRRGARRPSPGRFAA